MIRHLTLLLFTYVALVLDTGSSGWSLPQGTAPQFLLLTAAVALLCCDGAPAVVWAACIGLLTDVITRSPPGLNVVLLANLTFFAQIVGTRFLRESAFAGGGVVWAYVTLAALSSLMLRRVLHGEVIDVRFLAQYAAGRAGGSVALFLAVMFAWRLMSRSVRLVLPSTRAGSERRGWSAS